MLPANQSAAPEYAAGWRPRGFTPGPGVTDLWQKSLFGTLKVHAVQYVSGQLADTYTSYS